MKHIWKPFIFVTLNLLLVLVVLFSLLIYTSLFKVMPWYENCGMQFLSIYVISDPAFLVIGIALLILGRFFHILKLNKWIPFIAIAGFTLPLVFIADNYLTTALLIGTSIGVVLCLLIITTTIKNLLLKKMIDTSERKVSQHLISGGDDA